MRALLFTLPILAVGACTSDLNLPVLSPNPITPKQQECAAINGATYVKASLDAFKDMTPLQKAEFALSGVDAVALTCGITLNEVTRSQVQTAIVVAGTLLK